MALPSSLRRQVLSNSGCLLDLRPFVSLAILPVLQLFASRRLIPYQGRVGYGGSILFRQILPRPQCPKCLLHRSATRLSDLLFFFFSF